MQQPAPERMEQPPVGQPEAGWRGAEAHHHYHTGRMVHMTPLGMMLMSIVPVALAFIAGVFVASARQR
jgi:hypothetical protein